MDIGPSNMRIPPVSPVKRVSGRAPVGEALALEGGDFIVYDADESGAIEEDQRHPQDEDAHDRKDEEEQHQLDLLA
jgi:hypothetical protein